LRDEIALAIRLARSRTSDRGAPRFTKKQNGKRLIVDEPPLITHVPKAEAEGCRRARRVMNTLSPQWRRVLGGYTLIDLATKWSV